MRELQKLVVVTGTQHGFRRRRVFTGVTAPTDAVTWAQDKEQVTITVMIG